MQMVNDRLLSPLLVQMAVFSAIDATERTVGAASFRITRRDRISGRARAGAHRQHVRRAITARAMQASLSAAIPLAYVLQSGFDALKLKKVDARHRILRREEAVADRSACTASQREVRPGEKVEL